MASRLARSAGSDAGDRIRQDHHAARFCAISQRLQSRSCRVQLYRRPKCCNRGALRVQPSRSTAKSDGRTRLDARGRVGRDRGTISGRAAKRATSTIPIVFTTGDDPVKVGLVASLNKPGGNLTGVSIFTNRLGSKRFALLHEMVPFASPIAILINPTNSDTEDEAKDVQEAARSLGVQVFVVSAGKADDLDGAFARLEQQGARALFVAADTFFTGQRSQISILAARHGLPSSWSSRIETEAGGLMSYGGSFLDVYRQAGVLAGDILKGANPADLPVQLPTKYELVINMKTAKALGLTVPPTLLASADEVME